jgi:hypothetical protein
MEIVAWLNELDLGQYAAVFRDNAIDAQTLPDLTDADLEKLGVLLGHRKRLLRAVAKLNEAGAPLSPTDPPGKELSRLDTRPARTPVNASATPSRAAPHDSGPVWLATPSLYDSFIHNTLPV